jgi:hypothetical protein
VYPTGSDRHGTGSDRHGTGSDRHGTGSDRHGTGSDRHGTGSDRHGTRSAPGEAAVYRLVAAEAGVEHAFASGQPGQLLLKAANLR